MTKPNVGYQLPDGDAFEAELDCAIVYFPNRDEYRRALLGSLTYFATWIAWERDSEHRGLDAARAWQLALDKTLECWDMACFDELIETLNELTEAFLSKKDCCDANVTYFPEDPPETDIEPGVGEDPTHYGETEVDDWDEWLEYLCFQAHAYVDYLVDVADQLNNAVYPAWIGIGLIAALLAILSFSGIGLPIAFGLAASVVGSLLVLGSGAVFGQAKTDLEDAREDIVCAIMGGLSLEEAVEDALASGVAWEAFYQFVDYDAAAAILYEGGWDGEYLEAQSRDDCDCDPLQFEPYEYVNHHYKQSHPGWPPYGRTWHNDYAINLWYTRPDQYTDPGIVNAMWTLNSESCAALGGSHEITFQIRAHGTWDKKGGTISIQTGYSVDQVSCPNTALSVFSNSETEVSGLSGTGAPFDETFERTITVGSQYKAVAIGVQINQSANTYDVDFELLSVSVTPL